MDLQGKVIITVYSSELDYQNNGKNKKIFLDSSVFRYERGILFEASENSYVVISFSGNSTSKLYIQTEIDTNYEYVEINGSYTMNCSDIPIGVWKLAYEYLGIRYERFFKIVPFGDIDEAGLENIRDVIESISPGLSYDYSKASEYIISIGDSLPNVVRIKYNVLKYRKKEILRTFKNIIDHPITNLKKEIIKSNTYGKQNSKTALMNSKKPIAINNVITVETIDNKENSMLYFILVSLRKECQYIKNQFEYNILQFKNELENLYKVTSNNKYYLSIKEKYEDNVLIFNDSLDEVTEIISCINDCIMRLGLNELSMVKKVVTASFMKNINYHYLFDLYSLMISERIDLLSLDNGNKELVVDNKSTNVLFELYSYCIIKKILIELGYHLINSVEHLLNFTSVFYNYNNKIEVYYNTKFSHISDITKDYQGLLKFHTHHDTPDLTIIKYDSTDRAVGIIAIDAKCRKAKNIFPNGKPDDKIMEALLDYYQLRYKPRNEKTSNLAVSEVMCTYPYCEQIPYYEHAFGEISFIGLELTKDYRNKRFYKIIKDKIEKL